MLLSVGWSTEDWSGAAFWTPSRRVTVGTWSPAGEKSLPGPRLVTVQMPSVPPLSPALHPSARRSVGTRDQEGSLEDAEQRTNQVCLSGSHEGGLGRTNADPRSGADRKSRV